MPARDAETYLFHEITTADDYSRILAFLGFLIIIHIGLVVSLFEMPWNNEFKFPSTLLPEIVDARNPAASRVG